MIKFILFGLFLSQLSWAQLIATNPEAPTPQCRRTTSSNPPFFVSDTFQQGHLEYENFRHIEDPSQIEKYIPRGSIVYAPPELVDVDSEERRVPVKVLNVNTEFEAAASGAHRSFFRDFFRTNSGVSRVTEGDIGYLDNRSLKPAGEFTFYLEKDAPLYRSPRGTPLNGKKIKPKKNSAGKYLMNRCCFTFPGRNPSCYKFHIYDILNKNNRVIESAILSGLGCGFLGDLDAVPEQYDSGMGEIYNLLNGNPSADFAEMGIGDLELFKTENNYRGRDGNIPLIKFPMDKDTRFGPFNSRHYSPDDQSNSDAFIHPVAGCAFLRVMEKWNTACFRPGCQVQFGNMFHREDWQVHETHDSGYCIDLRPFRKSSVSSPDRDSGVTITDSRFDRTRNRAFMKLLMKAGASDMIFGDNSTIRTLNSTENRRAVLPNAPASYWRTYRNRPRDDSSGNHDNHIHVCFNPADDLVKNTCDKGL